MTFVERRATKRFQMKLPMTVRWTSGSAIGEAHTESEDISSRGVYFFLPKEPKSGSAVEIVLTLLHETTFAGPLRVRCLGHVRRTEVKKLDRVGVVAKIERHEFLRGNENAE
jgi:PilZ domain